MADENKVIPDQSTNNSVVPPVSNADRMYPDPAVVPPVVPPVVDPAAPVVPAAPAVVPPVVDPVPPVVPVVDPAKPADPVVDPAKPADPAKPVYKIPETMKDAKESVDEVLQFAETQKLSPEQTQVLLDREAQIMINQNAAQLKHIENKKTEWAAAARADKEIGGEAFEANLAIAQKVYKLAPESIQKYLTDSGLGSHPDAIKWFLKIGKSGLADTLIPAGNETHVENRSAADRLYANSGMS